MTTSEKLANELHHSVFGEPWHGASLDVILKDVAYQQAFNRPIKNAHNIAELVLHIDAWIQEALDRLNGKEIGDPSVGDWPPTTDNSEKYWIKLTQQLYDNTNKLIAAVKNFPAEKFNVIVGSERNAAMGTGYTYEFMISGVLQHNAYHGGQISLLKKRF